MSGKSIGRKNKEEYRRNRMLILECLIEGNSLVYTEIEQKAKKRKQRFSWNRKSMSSRTVSHHLQELVRSGLVVHNKRYYRITERGSAEIQRLKREIEGFNRDSNRLIMPTDSIRLFITDSGEDYLPLEGEKGKGPFIFDSEEPPPSRYNYLASATIHLSPKRASYEEQVIQGKEIFKDLANFFSNKLPREIDGINLEFTYAKKRTKENSQ